MSALFFLKKHTILESNRASRVQKMTSRWWQLKYVLFFTPKFGEDDPILTSIFFRWGWFNHQLVHHLKVHVENPPWDIMDLVMDSPTW